MWSQVYDPFNNMFLSTLAAAVPVVVLLGLLAFHVRAHLAAVIGLVSALAVAIFAFGMPVKMAGLASLYGAAVRLAADRLDRPQHHLPAPPHRGERLVQGAAGQHRQHHR